MEFQIQGIAADIFAATAIVSFGIIVWIGHTLATVTPAPGPAKWIGGAIIAGFVTFSTYTILISTGTRHDVALMIAGVAGSSGEKGLNLLWNSYFGKGKNNVD